MMNGALRHSTTATAECTTEDIEASSSSTTEKPMMNGAVTTNGHPEPPPPPVPPPGGGPRKRDRTSGKPLEPGTTLAMGAQVFARAPGFDEGWYAGTVIGITENPKTSVTYRIVFLDGQIEEAVAARDVRYWDRPGERIWHKMHKFHEKSRSRRPEGRAMQRTVEQLDLVTKAEMSRWPTAARAQEAFPWIPDPVDIVACCRGQAPQAGGYQWRFVEHGAKLDANDVDQLLSVNAEITIQQKNPKRVPSKSQELYEQYKTATTVREMLALGGRRGDISYDIAHGWIKFKDPELARRFTGAALSDAKKQEDEKEEQDAADADRATQAPKTLSFLKPY